MHTLIFILLPLIGTTLGSAAVLLPTRRLLLNPVGLNGFAAGVMTAASVWSLLIPAIEQSVHLPVPSYFPALAGLWIGFLFLRLLEHFPSPVPDRSMLCFAVALHNLPEGMAVGAAIAAWQSGAVSLPSVAVLSLGIAIQNLPEGAIISLPLKANGTTRLKALGFGILSGIIEPLGAILTILLWELVMPVLPFLLSFSAGAMLYVVVSELIADSKCALWFAAGFSLMMVLDVALG